MALGTLTPRAAYTWGNRRVRTYDVQLTTGANYTTGGETITPAMVKLGKIIEQMVGSMATTSSGTTSRTVLARYQTDGTIKLSVQTTASAEAASNSDQSTFTARLTFIGY